MSKPKLGSGARFAAVEKKSVKGRKRHGMQMGPSGFGLVHGYTAGDEKYDNEHEMKGCN